MTTLSAHQPISDSLSAITGLFDDLQSDFAQACTEYAEARRHQQAKDTPAHRDAVLESRARVDAILDVYLETAHR
ncbi:hypothetical protein ACI789_22570 [Geodermatophilus sp. SYSU D00965]